MPLIECYNLTRYYGNIPAVQDVSLTVEGGEIFGFLGPNGAGKTTTIKLLTGLLRPTAGRCLIGGHDVHLEPIAAKSLLAYIPDNPFLYDKLTGREFLNLMADLYRIPRAGRKERIDNLLHLFELEDKGDALIGSYSRGMRQKIVLAGALIHDPIVVFLDEPTVGLDPRGARLIQSVLRLLTQRGAAVFISTHSLGIAEQLCHRVAIINKGRLIAQGTVEELKAQSLTTSAEKNAPSLEEIFLQLTGSPDEEELLRYLNK
jgi:ABC-2 type transport system ATP-binding protein